MNADQSLTLAGRFIGLPLDKRRTFLAALEKEGVSFQQLPIPAGVEASDRHALSYAQQRMWFLWELEPGSGAYNLPAAVRLTGALDVAVLEQAFAALVERHETLRTVFRREADGQVQQVPLQAAVSVQQQSLAHLHDTEREQQVVAQAEAMAVQPFDLLSGPLLRIRLLHLGDDQHVLLLTLHHIVADGWSLAVLIDEFIRAYSALLCGRQPEWPALPIQYRDYALWQRRWLEAGERQRQLDYWLTQLGNEHPALELPSDRPRPAQPSYRGRRLALSVEPALAERLRALSRRQEVSLFVVLLGAFSLLLQRYSGQHDIRIGTPIANRNRAEVEGLIGFFVNTQVLRTRIDNQQSVTAFLQGLKAVVLGAQAHQDLPFEQLVEALQLPRDASRTPLFQVMYNHQPQVSDIASYALPAGLSLQQVQWQSSTTQFDLTLDTFEKAGELHAALTYASDLFDAASIARMGQHWTALLQGLVEGDERRLAELPMLAADEALATVREWNPAVGEHAVQHCLHQVIATQAEQRPEAIAITAAGASLTYAQLDRRANALAHRLVEQGAGPDVLVGLAAERSPQMLVGLLAILKAGAAYVPLDPAYPRERLTYMIEDSRMALLLGQPQVVERLPLPAQLPVLNLDSDAEREDAPQVTVSPDNLAYVIYTSGSTGQPKGTLLTHRNVLRLFAATDAWFGFNEHDVWTLFHSFGFDFSVWEIFGALLHGGRLLVVEQDVARSPREFYQLLCAEQVTVLNQTPSAFKALMQVACVEPGEHALRQVIFGGEALDVKSLRPWFERFGDQAPQLVNMYGITETTVHVSYRPLHLADLDAEASSPIGAPINDLSWYLLDADLNPVAKGCIGELYIGRAGLARGYLNRGGLSATRFIPNPFEEAGARLYRSGDLARYRADGGIDYIGRIDHQVKIRGFRIELGEIEAQLLADPQVGSVAVLTHGEGEALQLVAYVVPNDKALLHADADTQAATREQIKARLRGPLPDYMVPAHLLLLESLPLTTNGKLDRTALPQPDASLLQGAYVAPQGQLEQAVAEVWAQVLQLPQIGAEDDFFALGGHSLLATQVVSRLSQALGRPVPLKGLFEHATLRAFAASLEVADASVEAPLRAVNREQPLPLSFAQERQWYLWQLDPQSSAYHIPSALLLSGPLDVTALEQAFNCLLQRHESLRTTFSHEGAQLVQRIAEAAPLRIAVETLADHAERGTWLQAQASQVFDLEHGPLLRVGLLRESAEQHVLAVTQHHIVSDAWSMQRMVEELLHAYDALRQGRTPDLPALPVQYADYAVWQRERLAAGEGERQLAYWQGQLGSDHTPLELPLDRPRPAQASGRGATLGVELPAALVQRLRALAQQEGATLFMLLLASWQVLLHRYSGQAQVRVGVPVANRQQLATEGLLGFFVNTQVLQAHIDPQMPLRALLAQVRQSAVEAQAHQDLPFERLVEALQPQRSQAHHPLFQVLFNHQAEARQQAAQRQLGELRLQGLALSASSTQFDLMLDTFESAHGLQALFTYATELFDAASIERMARHWQTLLQGMVAAPEQRIGALPLLDDAERSATLLDWNPLVADYPVPQCLHTIIATQAEQRPEAIAVTAPGASLTYAQLDCRANALAHRLVEQGAGPDVLVGLAAERSPQMLVGLLAILKTGAAYVPLDPAYPRERLAYMIEDSRMALLLGQPQVIERLPLPAQLPVVNLDSDGEREDAPQVTVSPDNLAYVIYTSGSTGQPKGTLLTHRNVLRLFAATDSWFGFDEHDVWTLFHSFGFDFSVWEIFGALLHGGRLLVVEQDVTRSPREFYQLLCTEQVTVLNQTPSAFKALMQVACAEPGEHALRQVIFGGEALDVKSLRPWFERFGDQAPQLVNMYGITETTVHVSYRPLCLADLDAEASSPIGAPINDLSWYLLDADLNPVAKGCIGELYIGRAGLARGYLNRGGLSATRFIPNPFDGQGGRLYRSGDLARYRADGGIDYIGRIDHQVKIRGFRIELGEIEAQLLSGSQVGSVAVLTHGEGEALQLVAYVVPNDKALLYADADTQAATREQIKARLRGPLPDYMVPAHLLLLESLPLTTNGKLDRKALPQPDASLLQSAYVAPNSELQQRLAVIWQDVLGVERVGLDDDFFALGGHSLQLVMLLSRIRSDLGVELKIRDFHGLRSLGELATYLQPHASTQARDAELDQIFGVLDELEMDNV
ncbi:non-ribosomal peptide synthetase [Pseudomonas cremoricolorata]|uniref:non-ribosomal peptide synthetase n=1 Tax=Pseudomonas cremoricolorata TaxID=157783 RepID=UPI00040E5AB3|nr:non-ribosomal peptide synthetase [Pseudomonas cremoricolorata]